MAWAAVAGAAGSVIAGGLSASAGSSAAKDAKKDAQTRRAIANTAFSPVGINAPGGGGITFGGSGGSAANDAIPAPASGTPFGFDPASGTHFDGKGNPIQGGLRQVQGGRGTKQSDIGQVNIDLGDTEGIRSGLVGLAGNQLGQVQGFQGAAQDPLAQQAFANFLQAGQSTLPFLQQGAGQQFGNVLGQANQAFADPFGQGLSQSLLGQAGGAFGALPGTQQQARDQQLDLLRQQAQPFEERAFSNLQDNLFSTGRLGTTGGALQTEAFARGLGQADLQRQLSASQEGRAAQQSQLGLASGLTGQASGLQALQNQLLSGATGRFGQVSGLAQGLQGQQFNQGLATLQNIFAPQQLQQQLTQGGLANLGGALAGQSGLVDQGITQANLARAFMGDQAATRTGASAIGVPVDTSTSTAFAQLAGALAPQGGIGGAFGALADRFGGGGQQQVGGSFAPTGASGFSPFADQRGGG